MTDILGRLHKAEWVVRDVAIHVARLLVERCHYARGAANTATYLHGLYRVDAALRDADCLGVAWWIPPTKSAAIATYPPDWQGVLCLSRMAIDPAVPRNACSFLLARSRKLIDRERWPALVTYADEWQGHTGAIYRADNWRDAGYTTAEATFVLDGRMVARKAGGHTRTRAEMAALGAECVGRYRRRKFVHIVEQRGIRAPVSAGQPALFGAEGLTETGSEVTG